MVKAGHGAGEGTYAGSSPTVNPSTCAVRLVRQAKLGVFSRWNSCPGKERATPPGIESWAYGGNDMS